MTCPLLDITSLKVNLADVQKKMEVSNNTISDLRTEIEFLRNAVSVSRSPDASNVNTRRGAQNASIGSFESASSTASLAANTVCAALCPTDVTASTPVEGVNNLGTSTPKRAYATIVASNKPAMTQTSKRQALKQKGDKQSRCENKNKDTEQRGPDKDKCDQDGFIKVEKKRKKHPSRNQCGTALAGPNMLLRPAVPMTQLYVSRLHHSTKVEDIVEYVRVKTGWTLRVEKLESRHITNFKSFVVRVPTQYIETCLKEEFWPKGVVYRRFRGRLRDTTQRNTTPSIRVQ